MKFLVLLTITFYFTSAYSQEKPLKVFIKGQEGKDTIDIDFLRKGFDLEVSDTSFKIQSFLLNWSYGDWIYEMVVNGTHVEPNKEKYSLRLTEPNSLFVFEDIRAIKDGRSLKLAPFFILAADPDSSHFNLKRPLICHNSKKELACYNDDTYLFDFSKNRFTGFTTADSVVHYDEKEKKFEIRTSPGNIAIIQLQGNSLFIKTGQEEHSFNSIPREILKSDDLEIRLKPSGFIDTVEFAAAGKNFTIEISRLFKKWFWEITERHSSSLFYITYHYKKNRPEIISLQDQNLKYGMVIHNRFHSSKKVWILQSSFVERRWEQDHYLVTTMPLKPSYYYSYNRFGKLKKKKSTGEIKYCQRK